MIDLKATYGDVYRIALDPTAEIEPSRAERLWLYRIPCKYGWISVHSSTLLMAYCHGRLMIGRLLALPGVTADLRGDHEVNVISSLECLDAGVPAPSTRKPTVSAAVAGSDGSAVPVHEHRTGRVLACLQAAGLPGLRSGT